MHAEQGKSLKEVPAIAGYRLVRDPVDASVYELIPPKSSSVSVGQAFDMAYAFQERHGARRVEPMFEVQMPRGFEKGDLFKGCHDPLAAKDDQWNLKQIRAPEAWLKIQNRFGIKPGQEAQGISIAHIDTGYTRHPEIWQESNNPIDVSDKDFKYDYYDNDTDPTDPLRHDHLLDIPGHGTGSASVIVSPEGCQLPGAEGCANGIARGAKVIPLRTSASVVLFDTRNLSRAIRDVAAGMVPGKPKLVSIAMGGPPTYTLLKAVESAEDNGVLIIAASGNYVGKVVWPARFRSTIAVSAINVRCIPWKFSSHGEAVDISAPGESVWRSQWKHGQAINSMGKGTTFATGNTSGAAALWMVWNGKNNSKMFDGLREQGLVTEAFRDAVKKSAWKPNQGSNPEGTHCSNSQNNTPWKTKEYGAGILDVSALLGAALPSDAKAASRLREARQELKNLPLFATLYPSDRRNRGPIERDYQSLFPASKRKDPAADLYRFETEIMYHYTMNETVQQPLDALVQGKEEAAQQVIRALLELDLSSELKKALSE